MTDEPDDNVIPLKRKRGRPKGSGLGVPMSPEAKANWLASVRRTNNKPSRGNKGNNHATGRPAIALSRKDIGTTAGDAMQLVTLGAGGKDPQTFVAPMTPKRDKEGLKLAAMACMEAVLDNPDVNPVAAAMIAKEILNRVDGLPVARVVSANVGEIGSMTSEERRAEIKRLAEKLGIGRDEL